MKDAIHVCSFDAVDLPKTKRGKPPTYEQMRAAVVRAGRFSVFEATATQTTARFYTRLCRDPELEITTLGYPWTGVRQRRKGSA